jgi:hypothetical protein
MFVATFVKVVSLQSLAMLSPHPKWLNQRQLRYRKAIQKPKLWLNLSSLGYPSV